MAKNLDNAWPGPRPRKPVQGENKKGDRAPSLELDTVLDGLIKRCAARSADAGRTLFGTKGALLNALLDGDTGRSNAELRRVADAADEPPTTYVAQELLRRAWALDRAIFERGHRATFIDEPQYGTVAMLSGGDGADVAQAISAAVHPRKHEEGQTEPEWSDVAAAAGIGEDGGWDGTSASDETHDALRVLAVLVYSMAHDLAYCLDDPTWQADNLWPILFPGAPLLSIIDES